MSVGATPCSLEAWPIVAGLTFRRTSRASVLRAVGRVAEKLWSYCGVKGRSSSCTNAGQRKEDPGNVPGSTGPMFSSPRQQVSPAANQRAG